MTKQVTIKNIDCFGSLNNSDTLIVSDELDGHVISNWHDVENRPFKNWTEVINYMNESYNWFGDIQEITAE